MGIGQITSRDAMLNGHTVLYLPSTICTRMPRPSVFWPLASNFTPSHGMIRPLPGMSVDASALRIASGSVEPARLIASAITIRPVNVRDELPVKLILYFAWNRSFTCLISGLALARSSAHTSRVMMYSASLPSVLMNSVSVKPALLARIMSGLKPSSLYVFIDRIASGV